MRDDATILMDREKHCLPISGDRNAPGRTFAAENSIVMNKINSFLRMHGMATHLVDANKS
jgi:hypothetical protein